MEKGWKCICASALHFDNWNILIFLFKDFIKGSSSHVEVENAGNRRNSEKEKEQSSVEHCWNKTHLSYYTHTLKHIHSHEQERQVKLTVSAKAKILSTIAMRFVTLKRFVLSSCFCSMISFNAKA